MMKKSKSKGEGGFTLLETIISVAALALMSGFILRMFLVSSEVNVQAQAMDYGKNAAITALETLKKLDNIDEFAAEDFFKGCAVSRDGVIVSISKYYDSDWRQIVSDSKTDAPDGAAYKLSVSIERVQAVQSYRYLDYDTAGKYVTVADDQWIDNIKSTVYELGEDSTQNEMVSFSAAKSKTV
jgi:type II secretory pathway pseudopilin PulG